MNDVMLDLETIGTDPDSVVISVGAVRFDPHSDRLGEEFMMVINDLSREDQVRNHGRFVSPSTVTWWMDQSRDAQRMSFGVQESRSTSEVLSEFGRFLTPATKVWGNGASFDNVILAGLYKAYGRDVPWHFTMDRCYRTMKNMPWAPVLAKRIGTFHNPLDDAKTQAVHLQQIFKAAK